MLDFFLRVHKSKMFFIMNLKKFFLKMMALSAIGSYCCCILFIPEKMYQFRKNKRFMLTLF